MSTANLAEHLQRPALRRVHPVPLQKDNQVFLGLQDPCMLYPQMMVVPPQAFQVMQFFNGERSVDEIAGTLKLADINPLIELVKKLDEFGLLWGPTCETLEDKKKSDLQTAGAFAAGATRSLGEDPGRSVPSSRSGSTRPRTPRSRSRSAAWSPAISTTAAAIRSTPPATARSRRPRSRIAWSSSAPITSVSATAS